MARLDERVARSDVGGGFAQRSDFHEAVSNMWVAGELVHLEDLVLHDARMDVRTQTHELVIAHRIVRARRRVLVQNKGWGVSRAGIKALISQDRESEDGTIASTRNKDQGRAGDDHALEDGVADDDLAALAPELAELDAVLAQTEWLVSATPGERSKPAPQSVMVGELVIRDEDWDEEARLDAWMALFNDLERMPATLAGAILWDAWEAIEPLQSQHWLGQVLISAYLRSRGKVGSHLFSFSVGLRGVHRERRRSRERTTRLLSSLEAMRHATELGNKELDRLTLARRMLDRRAADKRKSRNLPAAIDLVLSRPIVSAKMVAREAQCTPRGALKLIEELNVREMTGRGRYRAWGIL